MPPQKPGNRQQLDDEIAEFLRRAAQRRAQAGGQPARGQLAPGQPLAPQQPRPAQPPEQPPRQRRQPQPMSPAPEPARPAAPKPRESIADHVKQHVDSRDIASHADQLGQATQKSRQFESHVHQTFDHEVGRLAGAQAAVPAQSDAASSPSAIVPRAPAEMIAALLADADGVRNAFVLAEILGRPEHRW